MGYKGGPRGGEPPVAKCTTPDHEDLTLITSVRGGAGEVRGVPGVRGEAGQATAEGTHRRRQGTAQTTAVEPENGDDDDDDDRGPCLDRRLRGRVRGGGSRGDDHNGGAQEVRHKGGPSTVQEQRGVAQRAEEEEEAAVRREDRLRGEFDDVQPGGGGREERRERERGRREEGEARLEVQPERRGRRGRSRLDHDHHGEPRSHPEGVPALRPRTQILNGPPSPLLPRPRGRERTASARLLRQKARYSPIFSPPSSHPTETPPKLIRGRQRPFPILFLSLCTPLL